MTETSAFERAVRDGLEQTWFKNRYLDDALRKNLEGDHDEAERILRTISSEDPRATFNLGWFSFRRGDWKTGTELRDIGRWLKVFGDPPLGAGTPIWDGVTDLNGRTILLKLEGGFGDQIVGSRWIRALQNTGVEKTVVSSSAELCRLLATHLSPIDLRRVQFVSHQGAPYVLHDYWLPSMSAPRFFQVECPPYLNGRMPFQKPRSSPGTYRIGIRWAGNPQFEHEQFRRFDPMRMVKLASTPNTEFYSFQRDDNLVRLPVEVTDYSKEMKTWEDTYVRLADMDLVISSCTSVAHLAAAMGLRTWVVVPTLAYDTWALPGSTTPWYDNVTVYRQETFGSWEEPFARITSDLEALCCK